ncbi:sensor histidine kinase [Natrinema salsiterrestre]|uniref:PAS domain-containing sensor histidine kinase n=1 Tax=Natrinema salsiterrestre TaxID=2950540 RepID=A0A9Q4KZ01_9EURY|nr:PAS domain-containing sensor histidine kinase [Natrinema salsiterrestre]MDF9746618.1 PAS domain-containing sensor histidine kinase [Natrinema salsiterrestre]
MNILLSIDDRTNRDHLRTQLSESGTYDFSVGDAPEDSGDDIDLWIVDGTTLERDPEAILAAKEGKEPQYFPVLLICPEERLSSLQSTVWDYVDDVVGVPVTPAVLDVRLTNLLRTRALSLQALSSQQRFDSLVRTTSSGILFLDTDGTIEFANEAVETLFGYEPCELIGSPITRLIPPRLQSQAKSGIEAYRNRISAGVDGAVLESVGKHQSGHEIPIRISYGWFELDGDTYLTGIVQEMTAIKKRETRLQVLNRVLRHDIRNDMNVIQGYANLLTGHSPEADRHVETILSVVDDVIQLSEQARDLDRLFHSDQEAGKPIDVCALVAAKSAEFRDTYPSATVETVFPDGTGFTVDAIDLLGSVVDNLIENAIKHNDTDAPAVTITVSREPERGTVSIEFADNGPGLPQNDIEVIETETETPLEHASGLGLWLVNWIVTESGGVIEFSENEPRGSRLRISLPVA